MTNARPRIASIETALPDRIVPQDEALQHALSSISGVDPRRIRALYRRSGVQTRHIVLPRGDEASDRGILALRAQAPSTGERMTVYEREVVPLAARAARAAILAAESTAKELTHVIVVSCTGFMAPGLDIALVRELDLAPSVTRLIIGFMGCHGALNGLRAAEACAAANPRARVLLVCAELCSLHFTTDICDDPTPGGLVANALFADGAAAAIIDGGDVGAVTTKKAPAWEMLDTLSAVLPETEEEMGWRIGDHGFRMILTTDVPDHFARVLPEAVIPWLAQHGQTPGSVAWAVHPGGPRILDVVESVLDLPPDAMAPSRAVLAAHGNMSSPTVLFILQQLPADAAHAVIIAFGPGLAMEATLLRRSQDPIRQPL